MSGSGRAWKLSVIVIILSLAAGAGIRFFLRKTEALGAGSAARQTIAGIGGLRASLQVYCGDSGGKRYPESLEELLINGKYMTEIPEARIYAKTADGDFERVHRGMERQVKSFRSFEESDDSGGWGYISNPDSKEYGGVFINCTHRYLGTGNGDGVPWNTF